MWESQLRAADTELSLRSHTASRSCTAAVTGGGEEKQWQHKFLIRTNPPASRENQSFAFTPIGSLECIHGNPHPSEIPACIYTLLLHSTNTGTELRARQCSINLLLLQYRSALRDSKAPPHLLFNPNSSSMQPAFLDYSGFWQQYLLSCIRMMSLAGFWTVWMHCWAPFMNVWQIHKLLII